MAVSATIIDALKAPLRLARHAPDRLLHSRRRRKALGRLRSMAPIREAVFVCHGNINRSVYAAAAFSRAVPERAEPPVAVSSAGFIGQGRPASELAQVVAGRRGLHLNAHRSRRVGEAGLDQADLIVVMNTKQRRDICLLTGRPSGEIVILGDLDPRPIDRRTVQDPYGNPEEVFERVFDRIDRCIEEMVGALWPR